MVKIGEKINGIVIERKIKSGGFGSVFVGKEEGTGKLWAVKVMNIENEASRKAMEAEILVGLTLRIKNPYLISYKEIFIRGDECIIIMEYVVDGDLAVLMEQRKQQNKPFTLEEGLSFLFQSCTGLKNLHDKKIVHRDLKPANILVSSGRLFIISDFGVCRKLDRSDAVTMIASNGYISPELLCGCDELTTKIDIYAVGLIFLHMLCLEHPFSNPNGSINLGNVTLGKMNPLKVDLPVAVKALAVNMVHLDPAQRPSADEVLLHPAICAHISTCYTQLLVLEESRQREREEPEENLTLTVKESIPIISHPAFPDTVEAKGRRVRATRLAGVGWNCAFAVLNRKLETGIFRLACKGEATVGVFTYTNQLKDHRIVGGNYLIANYQNGCVWQNGPVFGNSPSLPGSVVSVEINMDRRTLHIFIDGVLQPVSFSCVPSPLVFYLGFVKIGAVADIVSFETLNQPSVSMNTPTAPIFDPEHQGYKAKVIPWNSEKKK